METIKLIIKSLKNNTNEIMATAQDVDTNNVYVTILGWGKFGIPLRRDFIKRDFVKAEHVEVWVENRYGTTVTLYTDNQDVLDDFDFIVNVGLRYNCDYFRNETDLNPRNFAKIGK